MVMLIYTKTQTERLNYILQHIFTRILGIDFQICEDSSVFEKQQGYKINYSDVFFENSLSIVPHSLLFEQNITPQNMDILTYKGMPICFQTKPLEEALPFDVFAACFFFLSRYEEYLPHQKDAHQRYGETQSVAYQHHFLHLAIVERWIEELAMTLKNKYPNIVFKEEKFSFIPTYDIDIAYAYRHKGFLLNTAGYLRSLLKLDSKGIKRRTTALFGNGRDIYDNYDYLSDLHNFYRLHPCYFFLVAQKRSRWDKNTNYKNLSFKKLIQKLAKQAEIGLHASYFTKDYPQKIDFEMDFLQKTVQKQVVKNRHHYLRFSLPDTYNLLESKGIKEEYSMGFAHRIGFRAGTCHPFLFFDLQKNRTSDMEIYPLLFMENALRNRQKPAEIVEYLLPYIDEIKRYGGVLVTLFHNQSFGEEVENEKWKHVYEKLLDYITLISNN